MRLNKQAFDRKGNLRIQAKGKWKARLCVLIPGRILNHSFIPRSITYNLFPTVWHQLNICRTQLLSLMLYEWMFRPYLSFICLMCNAHIYYRHFYLIIQELAHELHYLIPLGPLLTQ